MKLLFMFGKSVGFINRMLLRVINPKNLWNSYVKGYNYAYNKTQTKVYNPKTETMERVR